MRWQIEREFNFAEEGGGQFKWRKHQGQTCLASGRRQECSGGDREEASHLGAGYLQKRPRKVGSRCLAHSRYSVNIS